MNRVLGWLALSVTPPERKRWVRAILAEADAAPSRRSAGIWFAAGVGLAIRFALCEGRVAFVGLTVGVLAALIYLDWHTVESAKVLTVLFGVAALLSYWRPRAAPAIGLAFGSCLLFAHVASNLTGLFRPFYQHLQLTPFEWEVIAAVLPPSLALAVLAAALRSAPR